MANHPIIVALLALAIAAAPAELQAAEPAAAQPRPIPTVEEYQRRSQRFTEYLEREGLAEEFVGITTDGTVVPNLFRIEQTGISTAGVVAAADAFLATLSEAQADVSRFPVDHVEWRRWANQHIYHREGVSFEEMTSEQRAAAFALLGTSLSAKGLALSRDIMRLNETLAELNNDNHVDYGEWKFHLTVMGEPSADQPWGWQLDGHHLNLNYFVLGDQVVLSPAFWGSEPVVAHAGKYRGTRIMATEQEAGLAMVRNLTPAQAAQAILETAKPGNNILAQAFADNLALDYAGVRVDTFSAEQKAQLLGLIELYIGNLRDGHAEVRMAQIETHLADTTFAWIGETDDDAVFY